MSSSALFTGAAGAVLQELHLQITANNLANINTPGFLADRPAFRVPEPENTGMASASDQESNAPPPLPSGMLPFEETYIDFSRGALETTDNPLDIAINGQGFFVIETPDGLRYTRQGNFTLNSEQVLVTQDGFPVLGESGPLILEAGWISVGADGTFMAGEFEIGRLRIENFESGQLVKDNGTRLVPADPSVTGTPVSPNIVQGVLERSNTSAIEGMTEMIASHRLMEAYQKVIRAADDMDKKANELARLG